MCFTKGKGWLLELTACCLWNYIFSFRVRFHACPTQFQWFSSPELWDLHSQLDCKLYKGTKSFFTTTSLQAVKIHPCVEEVIVFFLPDYAVNVDTIVEMLNSEIAPINALNWVPHGLMAGNKWVLLVPGSWVTSDHPKIDCSNNAAWMRYSEPRAQVRSGVSAIWNAVVRRFEAIWWVANYYMYLDISFYCSLCAYCMTDRVIYTRL